jgi:hypothetical protein
VEAVEQIRKSWPRVVAKAEHLAKGSNPRFVVTSLSAQQGEARRLYEAIYCARGDMENRIKEQQLALFADRTSSTKMQANQLRLWFSTLASGYPYERIFAQAYDNLSRVGPVSG